MVLLVATKRIERALETYNELEGSVSKIDEALDKKDENKALTTTASTSQREPAIEHDRLVIISKSLIARYPDNAEYRLAALVKGTYVYNPPKPPAPPKSEEFLKQMERLRNEEAEREYQRMINPELALAISSGSESVPSIGQEAKQLKEQLSAIVNIMVSVASVAAAIWYWSGSSAGFSTPTRTLLSLFGAITVLIAEVVVYLRYKVRVEEAKVLERNKKEKKSIVSTVDLADSAQSIISLNLDNSSTSVDTSKDKLLSKKSKSDMRKRGKKS
ncbi:Vph2p [Sugiyamaella lignohabitans]|uniref:Vph2p n=1 Tax=Sugiyamaella lignohabitans TaxID=796027 RepID=A0A170QYL7_9ASCO|nr:Vph2p [Sugiyamaella lignohabitans]ANB15984.1 Vph2p [Sugiyamaella lignohabitans]